MKNIITRRDLIKVSALGAAAFGLSGLSFAKDDELKHPVTPEQALLCNSSEGIVVLVGCSHPGLGMILEKAGSIGEVHGVIGGFHGFDKYVALDALSLVVPCHCTRHIREIRERFPDTYQEGMVGRTFEIPDHYEP